MHETARAVLFLALEIHSIAYAKSFILTTASPGVNSKPLEASNVTQLLPPLQAAESFREN
jgi:hypothetical protein